ncbi:MAG: RNA polymerase sigma factor [Chthoniobacterales bacterium]
MGKALFRPRLGINNTRGTPIVISVDFFQQLVDAHHAALYRFAYSLAKSESAACDLTQQTFYIWATKGHTLRDASKAKSWLFTTLHREFLRGRHRDQRWTSLEELPPGRNDFAAEEMEAWRKLDGAGVLEALANVDEVFRAPLTLFYLESFSYAEIAETLGVPAGTVMSRLSRGKQQLRALLSDAEAGEKIVPFDPSREADEKRRNL